MRIYRVNNCNAFTGIRQDRNTVEQLKKDNPYDLNLPNQRRISNAIDELSKVPGEDNINFLLDVSQNLRYGTNIDLGKKSYNDWRKKLNDAAKKSFKLSDKSVQEKLSQKLTQVINEPKKLTLDEKEILINREALLSKIAPEQLKNASKNTQKIQRNLNYFIISSEIPTAQKLYILKRLNYFMSDDYKINTQLNDKKTLVLAEILNDIVIDTPESKIPNIKAANQRQHGMCAAISICRKALAYEDKANYVDMIITELDDSPYMQVYDRANLGKQKKVPIPKADIDYNYALKKGYRIIDASAMNWMNAADTAGAFNDVIGAYSSFDKENFGTFADTHIHKDIDSQAEKYQDYYRAAKKAKDALANCKKTIEKQKYYTSVRAGNDTRRIQLSAKDFGQINSIIKQITPNSSNDSIRHIANNLVALALMYSDDKNKLEKFERKYSFIENEPQENKNEKIKKYLQAVLPENINEKILNDKASELSSLVEEIQEINRTHSVGLSGKYMHNKALFDAAAAYRTMQSFRLDIPEYLSDMMVQLNIPDNESYIIENLKYLSSKIRSGKIDPVLKDILTERFENEIEEKVQNSNKKSQDLLLAEVLDDYSEAVKLMITTFADDLYHSTLHGDRKQVLLTQLTAIKNELENTRDKNVLENAASKLNIDPNRHLVLKKLDKYLNVLENENCTDEQYLEILNKTGHKSHLLDLKESFDNIFYLLFNEENESYIAGFNLMNGAPMDADIETTQDLYKVLATSFNNMSMIIKTLQDTLQISTPDGTLLNSADPKYAVLKKLENMGDLATEKELLTLQRKFDEFYRSRTTDEGTKIKFKDLPKSITEFTPMEKEALNKYKKNINSWYSTSSRRLNDIYVQMKESR